jgi:hypothetical protein
LSHLFKKLVQALPSIVSGKALSAFNAISSKYLGINFNLLCLAEIEGLNLK